MIADKCSSLHNIILCVNQIGLMALSVVYAGGVWRGAGLLPAISTRMAVFDTAVVDLTDELKDPVDLIFGIQLGGDTDINPALIYNQSPVRRL